MTGPDASHYGFTVTRHGDGWVVSLPGIEPYSVIRITHEYEPTPHDQAVEALHRFITEAQQALGYLRDHQEWHPETEEHHV